MFLSTLLTRVSLANIQSPLLFLTILFSPRCTSSLTSPNLQCLVKTLALPKVLSQLLFLSVHSLTLAEMDVESSQAKCFQLIKKFVRVVVAFLSDVTSPSPSLPVTVHGAMADGDRSRRVYYTASAMPELKWIQLDSELEEKGSGPMTELLQLLKVILSANIPVDALAQLEAVCLPFPEVRGETDPLFGRKKGYLTRGEDFASSGKSLLNLVYTDQAMLGSLLCSVTLTHKGTHAKPPHQVYSLLEGFVSFLRDNCRDFSCFLQPVLTVLEAAASSGQLPHSSIFLSILAGFTQTKRDGNSEKEVEKERNEKLLQFISQGMYSQPSLISLCFVVC